MEKLIQKAGVLVEALPYIREFYDKTIAPVDIAIEAAESFAAGSESAHVLDLKTKLPNGAVFHVHGIFTYRIDEQGKITNLRGYWSVEDSTVTPPPA